VTVKKKGRKSRTKKKQVNENKNIQKCERVKRTKTIKPQTVFSCLHSLEIFLLLAFELVILLMIAS
jgi:hypothetical protein